MATGLIFALACAIGAIVYGLLSTQWILAQPTGNERMREISAAVQEGAQAYLKRQYSTIALVGVVITVLLWVFLSVSTAIGFVLGAVVLGGFFSTLQLSLRESARVVLDQLCISRRNPKVTARIGRILEDIDGHATAIALPRILCNLLAAVGAVMWAAYGAM